MKMFKKILLAVAGCAALVCTNASAQLDFFGQPRTIQIIPSASSQFTNVGATSSLQTYTNTIDTHGYDGIAKIDFVVVSNSPTTAGNQSYAFTNTIQTSSDKTNWTIMTTVAFATSTSVTYTNSMFGGTNLTATDIYLLPGTLTAVTSGSAGYASPSSSTLGLISAPFTNTATINMSASGVYEIGFNIADASRYIQVLSSISGSNGNYSCNGVLTGRRASEVR